jgi:hypothetical protein
MMFCFGALDNCMEPHAFVTPFSNAVELFGGEYRDEGVDDQDMLTEVMNTAVGGPVGQQDCEMQRPGFNTVCADGNHARWGYCNNIPSQDCQIEDTNDADGVIGVGLEGQDCCAMGAGYTNYCKTMLRACAARQTADPSAKMLCRLLPLVAWLAPRNVVSFVSCLTRFVCLCVYMYSSLALQLSAAMPTVGTR